jgi:hypothetical protein
MTEWRWHWLEAEGDLTPWRAAIVEQIMAARSALAQHIAPPRLDILIARRACGLVIPELGLGASAYLPTLFQLVCAPSNPAFENSLADGAVRRLVLHEVHHCLRMAGPGYGSTLGEALVSEGLAGRFVQHVLGTEPEPWERWSASETSIERWIEPEMLANPSYDHGRWFFGSGDAPRWLGYAIAFEIVGRWAARTEPATAAAWIETPANDILAAAGLAPSRSGCGG